MYDTNYLKWQACFHQWSLSKCFVKVTIVIIATKGSNIHLFLVKALGILFQVCPKYEIWYFKLETVFSFGHSTVYTGSVAFNLISIFTVDMFLLTVCFRLFFAFFQVVKAASPVLLRIILIGAVFLYCLVSTNIHSWNFEILFRLFIYFSFINHTSPLKGLFFLIMN